MVRWKSSIVIKVMNKDKSNLGTGLDSLLGDRPKPQGVSVTQIPLDDLTPGQYQPRTKMHKSTLEELSQSIKEQGILQPLVVRRPVSYTHLTLPTMIRV